MWSIPTLISGQITCEKVLLCWAKPEQIDLSNVLMSCFLFCCCFVVIVSSEQQENVVSIQRWQRACSVTYRGHQPCTETSVRISFFWLMITNEGWTMHCGSALALVQQLYYLPQTSAPRSQYVWSLLASLENKIFAKEMSSYPPKHTIHCDLSHETTHWASAAETGLIKMY